MRRPDLDFSQSHTRCGHVYMHC